MKNEVFSRKMNKLLAAICRSDVIIKNGREHLVCLYYDKENFDAPIVLLKASNQFNDYFLRVAHSLCISCIDERELAKNLFDDSEEGKLIPEKYIKPILEIYSYLPSFFCVNKMLKFNEELRYGSLLNLQELENYVCKGAEIEFFKKRKGSDKTFLDDYEILALVEEQLKTLADEYFLSLKVTDTSFESREFFIAYFPVSDEPMYIFWQTFTVCLAERKIYVGGKIRFRAFEIEEVGLALDYYKALFERCDEKLRKDAQKIYKKFEITFRSYDIAQNTVKIMLDLNKKNAGIEYTFYSDKLVMIIYLKKITDEEKTRKYKVVITYNAFMRNPTAFKEFIANPQPMTTYNFWCRETILGQ